MSTYHFSVHLETIAAEENAKTGVTSVVDHAPTIGVVFLLWLLGDKQDHSVFF